MASTADLFASPHSHSHSHGHAHGHAHGRLDDVNLHSHGHGHEHGHSHSHMHGAHAAAYVGPISSAVSSALDHLADIGVDASALMTDWVNLCERASVHDGLLQCAVCGSEHLTDRASSNGGSSNGGSSATGSNEDDGEANSALLMCEKCQYVWLPVAPHSACPSTASRRELTLPFPFPFPLSPFPSPPCQFDFLLQRGSS